MIAPGGPRFQAHSAGLPGGAAGPLPDAGLTNAERGEVDVAATGHRDVEPMDRTGARALEDRRHEPDATDLLVEPPGSGRVVEDAEGDDVAVLLARDQISVG